MELFDLFPIERPKQAANNFTAIANGMSSPPSWIIRYVLSDFIGY